MDPRRFDTLARDLNTAGTRRRVLFGLSSVLGLALGASSPEDTAAKKKCGPCQKRQQGKCKGTKSDGTACNGTGQCLNGKCTPEPTCQRVATRCFGNTAAACCSGICTIDVPGGELGGAGFCAQGGGGTQCVIATDCSSGSCVGYRCQ